MTYVTSLELSKRLADVSGWEAEYVHAGYSSDSLLPTFLVKSNNEDLGHDIYRIAPAYDSGFLLRQLPEFYEEGKTVYLLTLQPNPIGAGWEAHYRFASRTPNSSNTASRFRQLADTPEDALAELHLALFEAGVLER